jgi:DDE superfamily endonuclease
MSKHLTSTNTDKPHIAHGFTSDEKSSVQALDRTQPSLPTVKGRAGTMAHDYKRHGTTTLFAALDVLTGKVIGQCLPRHRHQALKFPRVIDKEVPNGMEVHLILDNYGTHKHADVAAWLAKHPGSICISPRPGVPGSTWSSGGSGRSPTRQYDAACSTPCPT